MSNDQVQQKSNTKDIRCADYRSISTCSPDLESQSLEKQPRNGFSVLHSSVEPGQDSGVVLSDVWIVRSHLQGLLNQRIRAVGISQVGAKNS